MKYRSKPDWIAAAEQDAMEETARRIERYLKKEYTGRRCPDRAAVVRKMRKTYSIYGKRKREKEI